MKKLLSDEDLNSYFFNWNAHTVEKISGDLKLIVNSMRKAQKQILSIEILLSIEAK